MERDLGELRRRVTALGRRTRGARIPEELRREVIRYATERRRCGDGVRTIARSVGVSPESIRRWTMPTNERALVPIVVREDEPVIASTVTISAPGGYRVEGLTVAAAAECCSAWRDRLDAHAARVGIPGAGGSARGL